MIVWDYGRALDVSWFSSVRPWNVVASWDRLQVIPSKTSPYKIQDHLHISVAAFSIPWNIL
jgi:hypothetical protein